jgi:hypothetical protein
MPQAKPSGTTSPFAIDHSKVNRQKQCLHIAFALYVLSHSISMSRDTAPATSGDCKLVQPHHSTRICCVNLRPHDMSITVATSVVTPYWVRYQTVLGQVKAGYSCREGLASTFHHATLEVWLLSKNLSSYWSSGNPLRSRSQPNSNLDGSVGIITSMTWQQLHSGQVVTFFSTGPKFKPRPWYLSRAVSDHERKLHCRCVTNFR